MKSFWTGRRRVQKDVNYHRTSLSDARHDYAPVRSYLLNAFNGNKLDQPDLARIAPVERAVYMYVYGGVQKEFHAAFVSLFTDRTVDETQHIDIYTR